MSTLYDTSTTQADPKPTKDETLIVHDQKDRAYKTNPREILVQILGRPNESIHPMTLDSTYGWVNDGAAVQRITDPFGGWINVTRNWQTRKFLQREGFKWLLMIDADVGVPWFAPWKLADNGLPVCSGVVPAWTTERGVFANIAFKDPNGTARFPTHSQTKTLPKEGVIECHNAGAACIMIRRDVIERLWEMAADEPEAPYDVAERIVASQANGGFDPARLRLEILEALRLADGFGQPFEMTLREQRSASLSGIMARGEDICFTDRVRQAGFKLFADFAVKCVHRKDIALFWPAADVKPIAVEDWAVSVFDYSVKRL